MLENKVAEMLDQLASKLGVASAKVWEWSLIQVRVDAYEIFLEMGLFIAVLITCALLLKHILKKSKDNDNYLDTDTGTVVAVILGILALVGFALIIICTIDLFKLPQLFLNPEYAAFQNIIEQLSKLK